jgi:TPR repeat protein
MQARDIAIVDFKSVLLDDFKKSLKRIGGGDVSLKAILHLDVSLDALSYKCHIHGNELIKTIESAVGQDNLPNLFTKIESLKGDFRTVDFLRGFMHDNRVGTLKDPIKAKECYARAAEQGFAPAQNSLAYMYYIGVGEIDENPNYLQAKNWWEKSAEQGYAPAQSNFARFLNKRWIKDLGSLLDKCLWIVKTLGNAKKDKFYPQIELTRLEKSLLNIVKGRRVEVLANLPLILTPTEFESSKDSLSQLQKDAYNLYAQILKNIANQPDGKEKFIEAKDLQNKYRRHLFYSNHALKLNGFPPEIVSKITSNLRRGGLPNDFNNTTRILNEPRLLKGEDRTNKRVTDMINAPDKTNSQKANGRAK